MISVYRVQHDLVGGLFFGCANTWQFDSRFCDGISIAGGDFVQHAQQLSMGSTL